jgi:hypothetical protein
MAKAIDYLKGAQPERPFRELVHEEWSVVVSRFGDKTRIYLAEDYAHS